MRSTLLLAALLCVLCATPAEAQAGANALKLCGRSLLRAVVYACGGSRWRRATPGEDDAPQGSRAHPRPRSTGGSAMDRRRRDRKQAVMSACCDQGCRMSDLFALC